MSGRSDDIERLRAAARARSRSRDRGEMPLRKPLLSYAPDERNEDLINERTKQNKDKHKYDGLTKATADRRIPRNDDCTAIVQGLKPDTDERQIYQFFTKCGKIKDVQ